MKPHLLAIAILLSAAAFGNAQAPAQQAFPPGATLEQKKAIIAQRLAATQAQRRAQEVAKPKQKIEFLSPLDPDYQIKLRQREEAAQKAAEDAASAKDQAERSAALLARIKRYYAAIPTAPSKSIKEVDTDKAGFVGTPVRYTGKLEHYNSYYDFYEHDELTHYAFRLTDRTGHVVLYIPRELGAPIREKLLSGQGEQFAECVAVIFPEAFRLNAVVFTAEMIDVKMIPKPADQMMRDRDVLFTYDFTAEEFQKLKAYIGGDTFLRQWSYAQWRRYLDDNYARDLKESSRKIVRVNVTDAEVRAFAQAKGLPLDGDILLKFAEWKGPDEYVKTASR